MNPLLKDAATPTHRLQRAIRLALLPGLCGLYAAGALAVALPTGSKLVFTDGAGICTAGPTCAGASWFSMEVAAGTVTYTGIQKGIDAGLLIGTTQPLAGAASHGGQPWDIQYPSAGYTTDHGPIDLGWAFFCNTGLHFTEVPITAIEVNATTQTLDFSGWRVTWNGIAEINMGGGLQVVTGKAGSTTYNNGSGLATLTCSPACTNGSSFTLVYSAIVPIGDPSSFGGTPYGVHMEGTLSIPVNPGPTVTPDSATTGQRTPIDIDVPANDSDTDGLDLTSVVVTGGPSHGGTSVNATTGVITYTPANGWAGVDTFTYTIDDSLGGTSDAATVTVTTTNNAPTAVGDSQSVLEGNSVAIDVLNGDSDDGAIDATTVAIVASPGCGSTSINPTTGVITFNSAGGTACIAPVSPTFTYTVDDDIGATSNAATVTVTVAVGNLPPSANDDTATTARVTPVLIDVTSNDVDNDGTIDDTTVAVTSGPSNGGTSVNATTGVVTYTPAAGFSGTDSFTYTVDDNSSATSGAATVTVTVTNVAPAAVADSASTTSVTPVLIDVLANDTDDHGKDATSVAITVAPAHGGTSVNATTGVVTYTPAANFAGTDTFQYTVNDDGTPVKTSNTATVTVTVAATLPQSASGTFSAGTNDTDGTLDGRIIAADLPTADDGVTSGCIGGCFDFTVSGITPGTSVDVVLPLTAAIPAEAKYRKLNGTWGNFVVDGTDNVVKSAPGTGSDGSPAACPAAGSPTYVTGLVEGSRCVQLTIEDGGSNDTDGSADGTVVDPGGVGLVIPPPPAVDTRTSGSSGCSLSTATVDPLKRADWWVVTAFLTWLGVVIRRKRQA